MFLFFWHDSAFSIAFLRSCTVPFQQSSKNHLLHGFYDETERHVVSESIVKSKRIGRSGKSPGTLKDILSTVPPLSVTFSTIAPCRLTFQGWEFLRVVHGVAVTHPPLIKLPFRKHFWKEGGGKWVHGSFKLNKNMIVCGSSETVRRH